MTELTSNPSPEPIRDLAHSVAELGVGIRDFLGRKIVREFMDELGLSGSLDETGDTAIADMLGVCVTGGIVLGMKKETDEASVEAEISRLNEALPAPLRASMGRLIPMLVPIGIAFHRDKLSQNTPKVQAWIEEFQLFASSES